jgi:hypothetical protein
MKYVKRLKKAPLIEHVNWNLFQLKLFRNVQKQLQCLCPGGSCALFPLATETFLADSLVVCGCPENGSLAFGDLCPDIISFQCLQQLTPV